MIYTSYFANIRNLPDTIVPISICGEAPDAYKGLQYKVLAPKFRFFQKWKLDHDNDSYVESFKKEVLDTITPVEVETRLYKLFAGKDVALICYEKPGDFCHRHLVAEWPTKAGIKCEEYHNG